MLLTVYHILVTLFLPEFFDMECCHSRINSAIAELFLYSKKLVVFSNTLRTAGCAGLDLAGIKCYSKVCDCGIGCFSGTMR